MERTATVGHIAAVLPRSVEYFNELGIDFCCGGNKKLSDIIKDKNLEEKVVWARIAQIESDTEKLAGQKDFVNMPVEELCDYIVNVHHAYLYETMPEISTLMAAVMRAHGAQHPEVFEVGSLFGTLRGELEQHLIKEELFLFPKLKSGDKEEETAALSVDIISEHEMAGNILHTIERITKSFAPPSDACATYEKVYKMLEEMNGDIHQHIHLENNILLKKYDIR